jgi:hypothetical protein
MNRLERIKGCLLGGVVGDALGQSLHSLQATFGFQRAQQLDDPRALIFEVDVVASNGKACSVSERQMSSA